MIIFYHSIQFKITISTCFLNYNELSYFNNCLKLLKKKKM